MDDVRPPKPREAGASLPPAMPTASPPQLDLPDISQPADQLNQNKSITPKPRRFKWLLFVFVVLIVLLAGVAAGWVWYNDALQPRSSTEERIKITVETGETADTIGKELEEKGVIKSGVAFQWYVQQQGALNNLKAGGYLFSPAQSVSEIVQWLVEGRVDSFNLTILPGQTIWEIKAAMVEDGFDEAAVDTALAAQYDHPLLEGKPAEASLEGYIFPDTYTISSETTPEQLFTHAFDVFYERIQQKGLIELLAQRDMTLYQGLTLASMVELEASNRDDRFQVAQVFEKRLQEGIALGSDVTYLYGAEVLGVEPSVNLDSPYNTRIYKGLPPGPISNFTLISLEAVANPAPGNYLYFVAGDDGTTHFSETEEGHQHNIDTYCTTLCQRNY